MLFVMDPIDTINTSKDTTYVIMLEAQSRGHSIYYAEIRDLYIKNTRAYSKASPIDIRRSDDYYTLGESDEFELEHFDIIWMRKDPPFNLDYIYATYILELADENKTRVINRPRGIRNSNEKLYSLHFRSCIPDTLVTKDISRLKHFLHESGGKMVVKPLDGYGGEGIFFVMEGDLNESAILESITGFGSTYVMAQQFIESVRDGDKRIILLNGDPLGAVLRIPKKGEFRCNFHSGGKPERAVLTERDREICGMLGPKLREDGLYLVGIDIVGGYLTEVNTTSPTCVQEINFFSNTKIESAIVDFAENIR